MNQHRATWYPGGVLLSGPYVAATPALVEELKRAIPPYARRYNPEDRTWFIRTPYRERALAIFLGLFPEATTAANPGADPAPPRPRARPMAEDRHYATLHLLPTAPRELIDAAYRTLAKVHHPDRVPAARRDQAHQTMLALNAAHEALHAHTVPEDDHR